MLRRELPNGGPFISKRDAWCYTIGLVNGFLFGATFALIVGVVVFVVNF